MTEIFRFSIFSRDEKLTRSVLLASERISERFNPLRVNHQMR